MNDKTEELRDIFTDVTDGEETVTESQENTRGSLERDERSDADRLESVVQQMRERYEFETELSDDELIRVARAFYDGTSDVEIADELGVEAAEVFEARLSLHLVGEDDADEVDLAAIRDREEDDTTLAAEYDVSEARSVATAASPTRKTSHEPRTTAIATSSTASSPMPISPSA